MLTAQNFPPDIQHLYDEGYILKEKILIFLEKWPMNEKNEEVLWVNTDQHHKDAVSDLIIVTQKWFNSLTGEVLPYVLYNRDSFYYLMRQVIAAIKKHKYKRPYPESGLKTVRVIDQPFWRRQ